MTSQKYIQNMIHNNERIYIDTATLMEVEWTRLFINNCREILISEGKKIIVPKAVCLELARHMSSDNERKSQAALEAIGILSQFVDLFDVQNDAMNENEIAKAFADCQLLSELTLNKAEGGQLLITNDRKLSKDAFDLNSQESCKGYRIMVCYLNRFGELHMCQCVKDTVSKNTIENTLPQEPLIENSETPVFDNSENSEKHCNVWGMVALAVTSFVIGIVVDEIYRARRYA